MLGFFEQDMLRSFKLLIVVCVSFGLLGGSRDQDRKKTLKTFPFYPSSWRRPKLGIARDRKNRNQLRRDINGR